MKQGTAKTLGVAALGAAFAVAAAGTASAAALPSAESAVGGVVNAAPVQEAAHTLPAGAPESLAAGQNALGTTTAALPLLGQKAGGGKDPVGGLLGGLPVGGGQLPTSGVVPGGLPIG